MMTQTIDARSPIWIKAVAGLGVVWNAYGLYQYVGSFRQTQESLMAAGMTAAQAELYLSLPIWMTVVFGIGVIGGLVGSVTLLMGRAISVRIFAVSFVGYVMLFAGDAYFGVFNNIPSQLAILAVVVAIAGLLLWVSWRAERRGLIT
jgi:hypothetical protein